MLALLIIPVLVAGFLACHIHPSISYKLHRYKGQYLYLKSAQLGMLCFFLGLLLAYILHNCVPNNIEIGCNTYSLQFASWLTINIKQIAGTKVEQATNYSWLFILSVLTFFAAYIVKATAHLLLRFKYGKWDSKIFVIGEILDDSPLDSLLFDLSLQKDKYVFLSMEDRKVYVGKVMSLGEPTETSGMDQDISILPLMSGYRAAEDLTVTFNTFYGEVDADIYLSLRQDSIVSASEFDFEAYENWNVATQENNDRP